MCDQLTASVLNEKAIKIISEEILSRKDFFPGKAKFREHLNTGHPW